MSPAIITQRNIGFLFQTILLVFVSVRASVEDMAPFAHPTEKMFAQMLDFHGLAWQYEPRTFAVEWDGSGNVREAFTPDFFLPEFDLYVELTMMKQSLVRHKNRKLRLLRELYPEVNIRVLYQKDIEDLLFKLGLAPFQHAVAS